jgi:hypothetical protein
MNKPGIWSQKFAAEVTKLWTPDEIRRLDGDDCGGSFWRTVKSANPADAAE